MAEYIERERIRKALVNVCLMDQNCPMFIAAKIDQMIDCEPAANVAQVVHGHWIKQSVGEEAKCSHCLKSYQTFSDEFFYHGAFEDFCEENRFCRKCGAKMDEEG